MEPEEIPNNNTDKIYDVITNNQTTLINEISERRKSLDRTKPSTPVKADENNSLVQNYSNSINNSINNFKDINKRSSLAFSEHESETRRNSKQDKEVRLNIYCIC